MGLHLNFELRLPATRSVESARALLNELRAFALTQSFAKVSALLPAGDDATPEEVGGLGFLHFMAPIVSRPYEEDEPSLTGVPESALGFIVNAGQGCETAIFGLLYRADATGANAEWFWHCCCKTQYASVVSDAHLILCHTSLVNLLDHAITLGFGVIVRDETRFWETRDEAVLLSEVHAMNRLVAKFAGAFGDAIGAEQKVEAPIFSHPRFERLEMGEE
jgi:hypothetical protein